jgi:class 3 adenylate cyclase
MSEAPFSPFVPAILTARLARSGRDVAGPDGWRTAGVVLVIDITGFTALTERLAERGPAGAETLASVLNESFGDVIERGELLVHGLAEQDFLHHALLGDAELLRLLGPASRPAEQNKACSRPARRSGVVRARAGIAVGDMWVGIVGGSATNGAGSWADRPWVVLGRQPRARPGEPC